MNQQDGIWPTRSDAPIYDRLVAERGDIPAEVNAAAARIMREAGRTTDFGPLLGIAAG
ncbi:hypothetical protein [Streptomyces sp. NPDC048710]|uniref:hypothetical protein n=1 Tax=unclassified Streptomyces TaxID=2593676 RepID=UPI003720646A